MEYVIADIHGCYSQFLEMLNIINLLDTDHLTILGDAIDRGPEPIKVLKHIINTPNIDMIMGNHEDMLLRAMNEIDSNDDDLWQYNSISNGGMNTFKGLRAEDIESSKSIRDFLSTLPLYAISNNFLLTHGCMSLDEDFVGNIEDIINKTNLGKLNTHCVLWDGKDVKTNPHVFKDYINVFGHIPVQKIHGKPEIWKHESGKKICIDTACVFGGRLACLRLDDMAEFYV